MHPNFVNVSVSSEGSGESAHFGGDNFVRHYLYAMYFKHYILFCCRVPWLYQYWPGGFMLFEVLCPGTPECSTGSGSGFKASQKTGQRLKVSSDRLREAGNRTCDPWFTRHRFIPYILKESSNAYSKQFTTNA